MNRNIWLPLLLAILGFFLVLGLIAYPTNPEPVAVPVTISAAGDGCVALIPATGGTLVEAVLGAPRFINPLLSDAYPVDRQLVDLIFDGLTRIDENGRYQPALAQDWTISEDGLAVRFRMREGLTWHDGAPVTAVDVAFTYGLLQDPNFPGSAAEKTLWQSIAINLIDQGTIEFILPQPYSPFLEATTRGILPAHLLSGVDAASLPAHPYHDAPVGTGPFVVDAAVNWRTSGQIRLLPNPNYWGDVPIEAVLWRFYPDENALLTAFARGDVDTIISASPSMIPELAGLPDVRLFTDVIPRQTVLLFNQGTPDNAARPLLVSLPLRQALAWSLDRSLLIDVVLSGQGVPLEGPYLPSTWAYNPSLLTAYTYAPEQAAGLLDENGWVAAADGAVRQQGETTLRLRLIALDTAVYRQLAAEISAQWRAVGIDIEIELLPSLDALRQSLSAHDYDVALLDIAPPRDPDQYDFWSQEAIVRGQNYAGWNNRRASESLEDGRQLWTREERRPYYNAFLRLFNNDLPALTLYQQVSTYAVQANLVGVEVGMMMTPRDRYATFSGWYLGQVETAVACPPGT